MVQVIKNVALAGLYLETGNLTNSGGKSEFARDDGLFHGADKALERCGRAVITPGLLAPGHEAIGLKSINRSFLSPFLSQRRDFRSRFLDKPLI
jgi:hypothetical protein